MEPSWETHETDESLIIIHDNRWLAIIGIPMILVGLLIAIGPWMIEEARNSGAWPILAGGSVIGLGFIVAGLSLCFKYDEIEANRSLKTVFRRAGLPPFRRTRSWPWDEISEVEVVCETHPRSSHSGSSLNFSLRLKGPKCSLLVASTLDRKPIESEGPRWADFLGKPFRNTIQEDPHLRLRHLNQKDKSRP